ncbi:MAG: hypothetical protein NTY17_00435, partial [Planctomycetia bacterium]|nr:hypothetical protein [Planctomycetia bacterium]
FVKPGFSLALLDPAAGKRERSLRIGQGVGGRIPSPAPDASQTIDRTTRAYPDVTGGAGILPAITTIDEAFAPEEDPLRVAEPTPQEWWILTRNPLADVTIAGRQAESESDDAVADISL